MFTSLTTLPRNPRFRRISKLLCLAMILTTLGQKTALADTVPESYLDSEIILSSSITVTRNTEKNISLSMTRNVQKIEIDALGIGADAMFEVVVNGEIKGTVYVPGQDPRYVVTVADQTRYILIRHLSGASVRINQIKAFYNQSNGGTLPPPARNQAASITRDIMRTISKFQTSLPADEFNTHLLPVKVGAGHSYAIATASGDLSRRLRESLLLLSDEFSRARPLIDEVMGNNDDLFDVCVETLVLDYSLKDLLD